MSFKFIWFRNWNSVAATGEQLDWVEMSTSVITEEAAFHSVGGRMGLELGCSKFLKFSVKMLVHFDDAFQSL